LLSKAYNSTLLRHPLAEIESDHDEFEIDFLERKKSLAKRVF
jgi:hypothetical protein